MEPVIKLCCYYWISPFKKLHHANVNAILITILFLFTTPAIEAQQTGK
jgi:hypothetical protein